MLPSTPATAEGDLNQTPFAHLVVYALDRRITGELWLIEPNGVTHTVAFSSGTPAKIRVSDEFARLGDLLVAEELITRETLDGALQTRGLLGDLLVLTGCVESAALERVLEEQFIARFVRMFSLPPETAFKYFEQGDTLAHWGGEPSALDPYRLLWMGLDAHGALSSLFESSLEMLAEVPLRLHPKAPFARFGLIEGAKDVVDLLALEPCALCELEELESAPWDLVRKVIYALLITRQLDLGKAGLPVGVSERPASLAKLQLKSKLHRVGAAAPDQSGAGERRPVELRRVSGSFDVMRGADPVDAEVEVGTPTSEDLQAVADAVADSVRSQPRPPVLPDDDDDDDDPPASIRNVIPSLVAAAPRGAAGRDAAVDAPAAERSVDFEAEESTRRIIPEAIRAMPLDKIVRLAMEKIEEREPQAALDLCRIARDTDPDSVEVRSVAVWARAQLPGADLKALCISLDETLNDHPGTAVGRYVRGLLRKRLGDDAGASSDFQRVLVETPEDARAKKELALLEGRRASDQGNKSGSLFGKLFRR